MLLYFRRHILLFHTHTTKAVTECIISQHLLHHANASDGAPWDQTRGIPPWELMCWQKERKEEACGEREEVQRCLQPLMSTSANRSIKLNKLTGWLSSVWVFFFLHGQNFVCCAFDWFGFPSSHLVPLWPLSSSCPLERDTYSNGLITRGVHFEEVHRDEMMG